MKKTPLTRKTPLKRGTSQLKRSAIQRKRPDQLSQRKQDDRAWFEASKAIIRERSQGQCEYRSASGFRCQRGGTQAHHINRQSQGHDHSPENLLWFCHLCHSEVHQFVAQARALGYLSPAKTGEL